MYFEKSNLTFTKCDNNIGSKPIYIYREKNRKRRYFSLLEFFVFLEKPTNKERKSCFGDRRLHEYKTLAEGLINTKLGFCNLKPLRAQVFHDCSFQMKGFRSTKQLKDALDMIERCFFLTF